MTLRDKTLLLTRDVDHSREFITAAEELGASVLIFPAIRIVDPPSWEECDAVLEKINDYDGVIFTSANAVRKFLARSQLAGAHMNALNVYAVGEATRAALQECGVRGAFVPGEFSAGALAHHFQRRNVEGMRFLQPRGNIARTELEEALTALGASVDSTVVYHTVKADATEAREVRDLIDHGQVDVITFASPSAVDAFADAMAWGPDMFPSTKTTIAVIGPTTGAAVRRHGWPVAITASTSTMLGMLDAIQTFFRKAT